MTDAERQRLAAILGMLGSNSVGERAAAALLAERFRKQQKATWSDLISGAPVYIDRIVERVVEKPVYVDRKVVVEKPIYIDREVVVERIVYRWPLVWRLKSVWHWRPRPASAPGYGKMDRSIAIALGAMPTIIVLASIGPRIREWFGY